MRICVFGAGAVGGHLAVKLALGGHDVSVVARGEHLAAIRRGGLTLRVREKSLVGVVRASDRADELGPQDVVISTLKATGLTSLAQQAAPLLDPATTVVFAQNGIPWWYPIGLASARPAPPDLSRLDPGGLLAAAVAPQRVIGSVIFSSNQVVEPGVIVNDSPDSNFLIIGEPDDSQSPRVQQLRAALEQSGVSSPATTDIRKTLWGKLLMNLSGSTLCLLTEQPVGVLADNESLRQIFGRLVREGSAIATAHGVPIDATQSESDLLQRLGRIPGHRPSILQDYELGRPMEIDSIIMMPQAFGRVAGVATPTLDVIAALAATRAAARGAYYFFISGQTLLEAGRNA